MAFLAKRQTSLQRQIDSMNKKRRTGIISAGSGVFMILIGAILWNLAAIIGGFIIGIPMIFWGVKKIKGISSYISKLQKGLDGEQRVTQLLLESFLNTYMIVNDVQLPINGKKTQIDHMVIGPQGILNIETKNWSAEVTEINGQWTIKTSQQEFIKDFNPMKQSKYHEKAIKEMLEKHSDIPQSVHEKLHTQTVVVFTDLSSRISMSSKENHYVFRIDEFKTFLDFYKVRYTLLVPDEVKYLTDFFKSLHYRGEKSVKNMEVTYSKEVKSCNKCGHPMVKKKGKGGHFYGCSAFPKCKNTMKVSG